MRYVIQLFIIICFSFAGELLHRVLPFPIPASIYGIILLFSALELRLLKVEHIREVSTTLIISMPVMFVPPAVGLVNSWEDIRHNWHEYLLITFTSTFLVMAIAGWTTQIIIWRRRRNRQKNDGNGKNNA
ncbi:MAG: CidA/LrgA family protein [Bacteroidaceae bacterium]|nr:CidA/LrgA family protein [Bacteroidaceae bacterium]